MDTAFFAKQVINGLTLGGLYALIAVGYTMVYGIIKLINFAHGEVYMLGGFFGVLLLSAGIPIIPTILIAMVLCAVFGVLLDRVAYQPLRKSSRLSALITAIGMSIFLQNVAMLIWGSEQRTLPDLNPVFEVQVTAKDDQTLPEARAIKAGFYDPIEEKLTALQDQDFDAVPTLSEYAKQKQSLAQLEADPKTEPDDLANARRQFEETVEDIPIPDSWGVDEGLLTVYFPLGTSVADANSLLSGMTYRARLASGDLKKSMTSEVIKVPDALDQPAVAWTMGGDPTNIANQVVITWKVMLSWLVTLSCMIGLHILVSRTRIGKAMRACALDKDTAALMGVNVNMVIRSTFAIGSGLAALAGILFPYCLGSVVFYRMGFFIGVVAFVAAVLGGIGNIKGAFLGGLVIGLVEAFSQGYLEKWTFGYLESDYYQAIIFLVLFLVIIVKPTGLLGSQSVERA